MGLCLPCLGSSSDDYDQPDPEVRRQQQVDAAEKRMKDQDGRGVKDPAALKRKQERQEKAELEHSPTTGGLRWQTG